VKDWKAAAIVAFPWTSGYWQLDGKKQWHACHWSLSILQNKSKSWEEY